MRETESLGRSNTVRVLIMLSVSCWVSQAGMQDDARAARADFDSLISLGLHLTLNQKYDRAFEFFADLSSRYPDHPAGPVFFLNVLQARAKDERRLPQRFVIDSLVTVAMQRAEALQTLNEKSPEGNYYVGTVYGLDAHDRAERGEWWTAFLRSRSSVSALEEALERDSTLYDAYVGIGTYRYWKSRKTDFLQWLPFVKDEREEGIRLLEIAAERGNHQRYAALLSLLWIFIDAERYTKAEAVAQRLLALAPNSRVTLVGLGTALLKMKRLNEAVTIFLRLQEEIEKSGMSSEFNELDVRSRLAVIHHALGNRAEAMNYVEEAKRLQLERIPVHLQKEAQKRYEELRAVEQMLQRKGGGSK